MTCPHAATGLTAATAHSPLADTPCPVRLKNRPRDPRGYPIPFLMMDDSIVTLDGRRFERCLREKLCMVCGQKLDNKKWFIGGQVTAINRLFGDPAMHEECARYSLTVCPFLAKPDMKYRKVYDPGTVRLIGVSPARSETQVLLRSTGQKAILFNSRVWALANPWNYLEHWRGGVRVPDPPGYSLAEINNRPGAFDKGGPYHMQYRKVDS